MPIKLAAQHSGTSRAVSSPIAAPTRPRTRLRSLSLGLSSLRHPHSRPARSHASLRRTGGIGAGRAGMRGTKLARERQLGKKERRQIVPCWSGRGVDGFGPIGRYGGMGWWWHFCRAGVDCAVGLLDLSLIFWWVIN